MSSRWRTLDDRLDDALRADLDRSALARLVYTETAAYVPYDFACLATTDPASGVITWASKTRDLGIGDEEFAASEYGAPDINKFEDLARRQPPVGALSLDTGGDLNSCRRHREFMRPRFGFGDELRALYLSRGTSWGALGMYRADGQPPFTVAERDEIAGTLDTVARAIQRSLFRTAGADAAGSSTDSDGPAVLIIDSSERVTQVTSAVAAAIEGLGGYDHGQLPASVLAVAAQVRTTRRPLTTRVLASTGRWTSLRAAPLSGSGDTVDVVVSFEATSSAALSRLALTAHGLTGREEEVTLLVLRGLDTAGIASALHLSPHTVQDHLKVVFQKVGVRSRRELIARLTAV